MSSWLLPGRKNDSMIRYKVILQQSFAFSVIFNSRNMEYYWYPVWGQTLSDLAADIPNLIVGPQYPVWFVPEDAEDDQGDEDDNNNVADDPEEVKIKESNTEESPSHDTDDELGESEGGELEISFACTVPEKDARTALVDFAVIHLNGLPHPQQKSRYGGWRITAAEVGLLVEVKKFASRRLTGEEFDDELDERVSEAREELVLKAAHLFIQYPNQDSVLALAAAGPYWSNTNISRADVMDIIHRLKANDPTYQLPGRKSPKLKWTNNLHLGISRSNNRLYTIYKSLKGMGVMETPENV